MNRDQRFCLASDHTRMMQVTYLYREVEREDIVRQRQQRDQDSEWKTYRESDRDCEPRQQHRGYNARTVHCPHSTGRDRTQARLVDLEPENRDDSHQLRDNG
jgi:hypothetical protein